jgi:hypothetical protein
MPLPSQGHYGFHSFPVVDTFTSHIDKQIFLTILLTSLSLNIFTVWKSIVYYRLCRDGIYFDKILVSEYAIYQLLLHMVFTSRNWFAMQGPVAIILISWNVIFIWETGNWTQGYAKIYLLTSLSLYIFTICKSIVYYRLCRDGIYFDNILVPPEPLSRNESGRFGALKSDSTHHFFRNACTKSGSLRFSQFSGC